MSWFVVGGIAIGATAGAIAGSKEGGDDVWKGALIGGAIGGAGGWAAAPAAAGAAPAAGAALAPEAVGAVGVAGGAAPAAGIMGAEGAAAGSGLALGGAGLETGGAMAGGASGAGIVGAEGAATGAGAGGMGLGQAGGFAGTPAFGGSGASFGTYGGAAAPEGAGILNAGFAPGAQAPVQMIEAPAASSELAQVTASPQGDIVNGVQTSANKTGYSLANQSPLEKGFGSAMSWLSEPKNAMFAGVLGLGALSMFNNNNEDNFGGSNVTQTGYPLSPNFKPTRTNPQQYRYASSYAGGGQIQSGMFPQSQIPDRTQFSVPSQMPTSAEVVDADYDTVTNSYSGEMPRFAKGGDTSDKAFADARRYQGMIDPRMNVQTPDTPDWVRSRGVYHDEDVDTKYQDALTAAQTRMGKAASRANVQLGAMQKPTPLGKLNLGPVVKEKQQAADYDDGLAGGGITSLGSYAHGGNPRLLRGPGDGMSDDIPASIADKQPARLADGEFVVPADVVSGLGNGSTEAGAKKLHKMMDNVRVARTGTKKQGKEIKAEKHMPGMASGGIASFADGGAADLSQYYVYDASGNQVPLSQLQDTFAPQTATPSAPTQPIAPTVNPSQYAMGGQYTPDYRVPGSTLSGGLGRWSNIAGEAERAARPASFNQQVTQSYLQNLGRAPDQMGFNRYIQSGLNAPTIGQAIRASNEYGQANPNVDINANRTALLDNLYQQYLGRAPEQGGMDYWRNAMQTQDPSLIAQGIKNSPEAQIRNAYQQFLGRTPDAGGMDYYQTQMAQGMTPQQLQDAIRNSEEAKARQSAPAAKPATEEKKARKGGILAAKK